MQNNAQPERGALLAEHCLIILLIAIIALIATQQFGREAKELHEHNAEEIEEAMGG